MTRVFRYLGILFSLFLGVFYSCFYFPNYKPIEFSKNLDLVFSKNDSVTNLMIGYSKQSIVPIEKVALAGYGFRKNYESITDSIYVRTIILESEKTNVVFVELDLLIITPNLSELITSKLNEIGYKNIYFSCSHSHSSVGGFGEGIIGSIILGGSNESVINLIVENTILAVRESEKVKCKVNKIGYFEQEHNSLKNRVTRERNFKNELRSIVFELENNRKVKIFSNNTHPTIISHSSVNISNDYPGKLCKLDTSDFTMFMAGTMGNFTPIAKQAATDVEKCKIYAKELLSNPVSYQDTSNDLNHFNYKRLYLDDLVLGIVISENIRMREWLFEFLFDEIDMYIDILKVGSNLFISLPIELSGKYYQPLSKLAKSKDLNLMLTTFNGAYVGYGNSAENFSVNHNETREMNWLGKYGGEYFNEVIISIIQNQ